MGLGEGSAAVAGKEGECGEEERILMMHNDAFSGYRSVNTGVNKSLPGYKPVFAAFTQTSGDQMQMAQAHWPRDAGSPDAPD